MLWVYFTRITLPLPQPESCDFSRLSLCYPDGVLRVMNMIFLCYHFDEEGEIFKRHKKTFVGVDEYDHNLDGDDGFTGITYVKTYQVIHFISCSLMYANYN